MAREPHLSVPRRQGAFLNLSCRGVGRVLRDMHVLDFRRYIPG
jgi:hypothetical protein